MNFDELLQFLSRKILTWGSYSLNLPLIVPIFCDLFPQAGEQLMAEKPETREQIEPILASLATQWDQLETTTTDKADKLFENKRAVLYEQSCDDIDGWVTQLESQIIQAETAKDLTSVNLLMQKQSVCSFGQNLILTV